MLTLRLIWTYVKKYWFIAAIIVAFVVGGFLGLTRGKKLNISQALRSVTLAHEEEIRQIQVAREIERSEHLANEQRLKDTLDAVQKQYDSAKKELDEKKKREVADLVKRYGNDPDTLAKKLADATGFKVVLPDQG